MNGRGTAKTGFKAKDAELPAELIPMAATAEQLGFLRAPDPCCPAGGGRPDAPHDHGDHAHHAHGDAGHHGDGGHGDHDDGGHGKRPPPEQPEDEHEGHQHMRVFPVFNFNERGEIVESVDREGRLSAATKRALAESKKKRPEGAGGKGDAPGEEGGHSHAKPAPSRKPRKKR